MDVKENRIRSGDDMVLSAIMKPASGEYLKNNAHIIKTFVFHWDA